MDEYFDDGSACFVKSESPSRWVRRFLFIGVCMAFVVMAITVCVAVAAVVVIGPVMEEMTALSVAIGIIVALAAAMCMFLVSQIITSPLDSLFYPVWLFMLMRWLGIA
jgi:hypothetical protein